MLLQFSVDYVSVKKIITMSLLPIVMIFFLLPCVGKGLLIAE
jgi:hypothetical protein